MIGGVRVRSVLRDVLLAPGRVVPLEVRRILDTVGAAAECLIGRGWVVDHVDEDGAGLVWGPVGLGGDVPDPVVLLHVGTDLAVECVFVNRPGVQPPAVGVADLTAPGGSAVLDWIESR